MIKYEQYYQEITGIIRKLAERVEAEMVVVIDKNGQQIACYWKKGYLENIEILDFLERKIIVGSIDRETVKIKNNTAYIHFINDKMRLVIIFNKGICKRVSFLALGASRQINSIFESIVSSIENTKESDDFSDPSNNSGSSSNSCSFPIFSYRYRN